MTAPLGVRLDAIEAALCELVSPVVPGAHRGRGRPAILPAAWLWTGLLVCLLRGDRSFQVIWRRLTVGGCAIWAGSRSPPTRSVTSSIAAPARSWSSSSGTPRRCWRVSRRWGRDCAAMPR